MRMLRYCLQISLLEHQKNEEIRREANVMPILDVMRKRRLEWFGHVCRREKEDDIRRIYKLKMEGKWCDLNRVGTEDRLQWKNLV